MRVSTHPGQHQNQGLRLLNSQVDFGGVKVPEAAVSTLYLSGSFVITNQGVFEIHYSSAQKQFYSHRVIAYPPSAIKIGRGEYKTASAAEINKLYGQNILREE